VRASVLDYVAKNGIAVGGMHLSYPAVGTVTSERGGYHFTNAKGGNQ
jgi:hypothetical protein